MPVLENKSKQKETLDASLMHVLFVMGSNVAAFKQDKTYTYTYYLAIYKFTLRRKSFHVDSGN